MKLNLLKIIPAQDKNKKHQQWLIISLVAVFIILTLGMASLVVFEIKYHNKFFPGTKIGNLNLTGLTKEEALDLLDQITENIKRDGLKVIYQNEKEINLQIAANITSLSDPDLSREIISFNNHATIHQAFPYGRQDYWWKNLMIKKNLVLGGHQFPLIFNLDEKALDNLLREKFEPWAKPALNAKPEITWQDNQPQIEITTEKNGFVFDYDATIAQIKKNLSQINQKPIELITKKDQAIIKSAAAKILMPSIEMILSTTSRELIFEKRSWEINPRLLASMLEFQIKDQLILTVNRSELEVWLEKNISPTVKIEPRDASLEMKEGKINKIVAHRDGRVVDFEQTYQNFNDQFLHQSKIKIIAQSIKPSITTEEVNNLGIKEIIGIGTSNFAGSPANRRHNIRTGAAKLHGILIKPEEEFSLAKALGKIDATTGYLPELVIKGNQTIPEYGGGLCQIGTTIFRATMAAGLPITERRNHSYNVSYYLEDGLPGTDATIYPPHPDFRFINDTEHYVLIQTRIEGDDIYFDFWGTNDGRVSERTKPKVWGWTSPPPTKYIETTDLAPGQTKCTEKSYRGVNASFDYFIYYPDGETKKTTFNSYYRPWQAVCLIGVEKIEPPSDENE